MMLLREVEKGETAEIDNLWSSASLSLIDPYQNKVKMTEGVIQRKCIMSNKYIF